MTQSHVRSRCRVRHKTSTVARVARLPMKTRNFRAPNKVWDDSQATADAAGENLSDRLREFLEWYSRQPHAREPRRPARAVRALNVDDD